ncbi:MAG: SDR family NAD(P)-dependent oxidoreductase [Chitinophagales bacterium]|nr:SDR family NAD(P)-dependent oxidoreductase [Chitinophagales bacterium]
MKKYALVTGGSMGIGKALAAELASRGHHIVLVALDSPELYETASFLQKKFEVDVQTIAEDLTSKDGPLRIFETCKSRDLNVNILINNAGTGNSGLFEENRLEEYLNIIDLNNRAMVQMTYHFIRDLKNQEQAFILNTSSMEATLPLPYKAVYTATKNFIYAFSVALNEELKHNSNVKVSVLCPGSVITNAAGNERIKAQGAKSKIIILSAEKVAAIAIKGLFKGKRMIIPGVGPWFIVRAMGLLPDSLKLKILEKIFRAYKDTGTLSKTAEKESGRLEIENTRS